MTKREISARTCLIMAVILIAPGIIVLNPGAGVSLFILSFFFALIALVMAHKRFGLFAIIIMLIDTGLCYWRLPAAQDNYQRYIEKAKASATINETRT